MGHVANYVETEQVLEVPGDVSVHVLSFLQIRGSVPVFWTQSGIKYKPPIQFHKTQNENREAFRLHIERPLRDFSRLIVVNLVETAPGRQESKIADAYIRQLLLLNSPQLTYVGFDFHEYCKGLRFGNVSVLLEGVKDIIRDMKYCWLHRSDFMCKQESVFRVNCIDCLDRTNLVQSVFATAVIETQLRKLGRLPPEVDLPTDFSRAVQAVWADNGDALSRHYTGTVAMKGDFTRTGFRTVNGLMKDGVSSMNRYYQRFGEIKRQAAIDFLLGHTNSPELRFLKNCSTQDTPVEQLSSIEVSSLLAAIRSSCLQSDEDSFFEFVVTSSVITKRRRLRKNRQPRRSDVRAFGMLTTKNLHIIRFVDDPLTNQQAQVRLPIRAITRIAFGSESALFRQSIPVLRIYFSPPPENPHPSPVTAHSVSSTEALDVRLDDKATSERPQKTGGECYLDLRQPPFRLFNNYLVPVSSPDEAIDALRVVAESITLLLQSNDININIDTTSSIDTGSHSISVMQRKPVPPLPAEYILSLSPEVSEVLQQTRERLRPFLLPRSRPNPRSRRRSSAKTPKPDVRLLEPKQRFWAFKQAQARPRAAAAASASDSAVRPGNPPPEKGLRVALGSMLKQSLPLMEKVFATSSSAPAQRHKVLAPMNGSSVGQPLEGEDTRSATGEDDDEALEEEVEQGEDALLSSDIDDLPVRIITPTNFVSISDLIYELEAGTDADDDGEEEEEAVDLGVGLNHVHSAPAGLAQASECDLPEKTNSTLLRPSSSPLFPPLRSEYVPSQALKSGNVPPLLVRSLSCGDLKESRLPPARLRRAISETLMSSYRALIRPISALNASPKSADTPEPVSTTSLRERLSLHFAALELVPITKLEEAANPRFVSRLRQRQEANASAVERQRHLTCPSDAFIQTQFVLF
uniref:SAC domain-containing protein n=1 Tax=Mesocestoides corti TaxID=53468 RepID=A0A5K3EHM7_MESCO